MEKKKNKLKLRLLLLLIPIVSGAVAYFYFKSRKLHDFEPLIKEKLQNIVAKAFDSLYVLEYDKLDIDLANSKIILLNMRLQADSNRYHYLLQQQRAPDDVVEIKLKTMAITDITPSEIIVNKVIDLKLLYLDKPQIIIYHRPQVYNSKMHPVNYNNLYQHISGEINEISVHDLWLRQVDFSYHNEPEGSKVTEFKNIDFRFTDLLIDSSAHLDSLRFLYASNCTISIPEYQLATPDSMYHLKLDSTSIQTRGGIMTVKDINLKPRYSEMDFAKKVGHQIDRLNIHINHARLANMNWYGLLQDTRIQADTIFLEKGSIAVYGNKNLPQKGNKLGTYPNQRLKKLKLPVNVRFLRAKNFNIIYKEQSESTGLTGEIRFMGTEARISNIVNDSLSILKNSYCRLEANTLFMGNGKLSVAWTFDLAHAREGKSRVAGKLQNFQLTNLNSASKSLGKITFDEGSIPYLNFDIDVHELFANANVQASYRNAKMTLYKQDFWGDSLKVKPVANLVTGIFMKKDKDGNNASVRQERDISKSVFGLLWKSILQGTKASLGIKK